MKNGKIPKEGDALRHYVAEKTSKLSIMELRDLLITLISLQKEAFHIVHDIDRKLAPRLLNLEVLYKRAMDAFVESGLVCVPQDLPDPQDEWPYPTEP